MTLYTYDIQYDNGETATLKNCDQPFPFEEAMTKQYCKVTFPDQTLLLNMSHVVSVKEVASDLDPTSVEAIAYALSRFNNDTKAAAEYLGISDRTLYRKAKEYKEQFDKEKEEVVHEP